MGKTSKHAPRAMLARLSLLGAVAGAGLLSSPPSVAKTYRSPPVAQQVDLNFADAKGRVHTIEVTATVPALQALRQACPVIDAMGARAIVATRQPELDTMNYLGSNCPGASVDKTAKPVPVDGRPAVVVLTYRAPDGKFHFTLLGDTRPGDYSMSDCPLVLKRTQASLLRQAQGTHVGQKFIDASCLPLSPSVVQHFASN